MASMLALEHCTEASAQRLAELIATAASPRSRERCVRLLAALPLTCRGLRDKARQDSRIAWLLFYERCRRGASASTGHFLDGVAYGVPLFAGNTAFNLLDADLRRLRLSDVIEDRFTTVASLEAMPSDSAKLAALAHAHALLDLPAGLPSRVHVLVSRARAVCQGLRRVKPAANFAQCRNLACSRLFYAGAHGEATRIVDDEAFPLPEALDSGYWLAAAGGPGLKAPACHFCARECCRQWRREFEAALPPVEEAVLASDARSRKEGRSRVPEALRVALKRNEVAARAMRGSDKGKRRFAAVSGSDIAKEKARRVRMLNVDVGLLYAAAAVADSAALSAGKALPGSSEGWRERVGLFAKPLKLVRNIYDAKQTGGKLLYNPLVYDAYLEKLRTSIKKIL